MNYQVEIIIKEIPEDSYEDTLEQIEEALKNIGVSFHIGIGEPE